jgi:hypothetical protein
VQPERAGLEVDHHELPPGAKGLPQARGKPVGIGQVVIDVAHQDHVAAGVGQVGLERGARDDLHVAEPGGPRAGRDPGAMLRAELG